MTDHEHRQHQHRNMDRDEDDERVVRAAANPGSVEQGQMDRGEYGGWASGEGQGEFAGDGYSAQGQFSNQRVAQYGDQGYDQDYGRQGIGWQNRQAYRARVTVNGPSESRGQSQRDETGSKRAVPSETYASPNPPVWETRPATRTLSLAAIRHLFIPY